MKYIVSCRVVLAASFVLALGSATVALGETPEKAQALLADVKKKELAGEIAAKQTELDRLNEDLAKRRKEVEALQKSVDEITGAINETTTSLDQLLTQRVRLTKALEVVTLRIDAERLKVDGLRTLSDAQKKTLDSATKSIDEATVRSGIQGAELKLLSLKEAAQNGQMPPKDEVGKLFSELADLKKKLTKSERASSAAGKLARETMSNATVKLQQADEATKRAAKHASETGVDEVASGPDEKGKSEPKAEPQPAPKPEAKPQPRTPKKVR
jgi:chromosome segregation ATPase